MIYRKSIISTAVTVSLLCLSACGKSDNPPISNQSTALNSKPDPGAGESSVAGKPTAPIDISYEVVGNAIVGVPVAINVIFTSVRGPINVEFSINDNSALIFQPGQVERLEIADASAGSVQQIVVIPQREGRVYVNVSAEIQAPDGLNIRSMAIPIKVGSAPANEAVNSKQAEGTGADSVISLPANEPG